jgi:hypothetical protein
MKVDPFTDASTLITLTAATTTDGTPTYAAPGFTFNTFDLNNFTRTCRLEKFEGLFSFYTLSDTQDIPPSINYPWNHVLHFTSTDSIPAATIGSSLQCGTKDITSTNYQLPSIPNAMMIVVVPLLDNSGKIALKTGTSVPPSFVDNFMYPIKKINLTYGNLTGVLSNATDDQLFQYSLRNGLKFVNYATSGMHGNYLPSKGGFEMCMGCPIMLKFSKEIFTQDVSAAPNLSQNTQIQYTITALNYFPVDQPVKLLTAFIFEGVWNVKMDGGNAYANAVLSRQDIVDADLNDIIGEDDLKDPVQYGGSGLWSSLRKAGKKTWGVIKSKPFRNAIGQMLELGAESVPVLGDVKRVAEAAYNTVDSLSNKDKGSAYVAGKILNSKMYGSGTVGGAMLNGNQIRQRLIK